MTSPGRGRPGLDGRKAGVGVGVPSVHNSAYVQQQTYSASGSLVNSVERRIIFRLMAAPVGPKSTWIGAAFGAGGLETRVSCAVCHIPANWPVLTFLPFDGE